MLQAIYLLKTNLTTDEAKRFIDELAGVDGIPHVSLIQVVSRWYGLTSSSCFPILKRQGLAM
jgi:hypothetical protein